jgi:fructose-1,6-bisphosphatase-3
MDDVNVKTLKYLELLSEKFPTLHKAYIEIINLQAILALPKGTEHFISDIHGEYHAFYHLLNSCSGVIREKVDSVLYDESAKKSDLLTLIYYTNQKLELERQCQKDINIWYKQTLQHLIEICRITASKYTRSKVRKAMSPNLAYIIDELLNTQFDNQNKTEYYDKIISTVIILGHAETLIAELCRLIKKLAVDKLHILGDIFDRGMSPDLVIDSLIGHHSVDIQWGNHDIVWMGAANGSIACILNVLYNCLRYGNMHVLEIGYGISMRELSDFAVKTYAYSPSFLAKSENKNIELYSKILKAVAIMMFKVEGNIILNHPEFEMDERNLLLKTDFDCFETEIDGEKFKLTDTDLPTIIKDSPLSLTQEEEEVLDGLKQAFVSSERLQRHISFLYSNGSLYKCFNSNLMFHGCVPMTEQGELDYIIIDGISYKGKDLFDKAEKIINSTRFLEPSAQKDNWLDYMWYFWCGKKSPLYGRNKMTSFERMLIKIPKLEAEQLNPYYCFADKKIFCEKILNEFEIYDDYSHIINGHIPVNAKLGESPIKADGRRFVIDGGLNHSYYNTTGNAGYTLIFNSMGLKVAAHKPFESKEFVLKYNYDMESQIIYRGKSPRRIKVRDTDTGKILETQIADLMLLAQAYKKGYIKEK